MQSLRSPEGVVYGNGETLPDATVLETFDFRQHLLDVDLTDLARQPNIANVPGFPDCVVRAQPLLIPAGSYAEHVEHGLQHFALLEEAGIRVPAQRFVLAKDRGTLKYNPRENLLFTFVERLEGDTLTYHQADADLNQLAISSIAKYALGVCGDEQKKHMLGDLTLPRQFTKEREASEGQPSLVLHDTDLVFSFFGEERKGVGFAMHGLGESLQIWSDKAQIETPELLKELQKISEPLFRQLLGLEL